MTLLKPLLKKEWEEIVRERLIILSLAFMPVLFVGLALYLLTTIPPDATGVIPPPGFDTARDFAQFVILSEFLGILLTLPSVGSVLIAAYAIVGEKVQKTFEPLLATPIRDTELFASKLLVAAGLPVMMTFLGYLLLTAALLVVNRSLLMKTILTPMWLLALIGLGPLLCACCALISMIVSSKVKDIRAAQQVSALVVLPVVLGLLALFINRVVTLPALLLCLLGLALVDALVFAVAIKLFKREAIITVWT
jgi:ABC-2 type transport system permease protein